MPIRYALLLCFLALPLGARAGGVAVVDASAGTYLHLAESDIHVAVENQVAVVTATYRFENTVDGAARVTFAFPTPADATPIGMRWQIDGVWYDALFASAAQDTTLPGAGGTLDAALLAHLGDTPLFFGIEQPLAADADLTVTLTYVQLLPYAFGEVNVHVPNDYSRIQTAPLDAQSFSLDLLSLRTIARIEMPSHTPSVLFVDGGVAAVRREAEHAAAGIDYHVRYALSLDELGLFDFSTLLPDSAVADGGANGFFAFVAEPDPDDGENVIDKVFTLIVDRSGSMSGMKIEQARDAAAFIVDNLNPGDRFNIVDFSSDVQAFRDAHVDFDAGTREDALAYIAGFRASGSTNISGAFETALPQFAAADTSTANLILFFTDGIPTTGITEANALRDHVNSLVATHETDAALFTFGIGPDVNTQLLTHLATDHSGLAAFLGDDELEARITEFYLQIRSPVLLDTRIAFDPPVVTEVFPDPLPSLYQGQQMIVGGRYSEAVPVTATLTGTAFGQPVSYAYPLALADTVNTRFGFLPKVWAKLKIEALLVAYHTHTPGSVEADQIKSEIIALSLGFGVISPFTSFRGGVESDDQGAPTAVEDDGLPTAAAFEVLGVYPNPFAETATLRFRLDRPEGPLVTIRIYDALGRLVRVLVLPVSGPGVYEIVWDGRDGAGVPVSSGAYFFVAHHGNTVLSGGLTRVR